MNGLKKKIIDNKLNLISIIFIVLFGLISFSWFKGNSLFQTTDFTVLPKSLEHFKNLFFIWNELNGGIVDNRNIAIAIPQGIFFALSDLFGLSTITAGKLWFFYIFTLSGLSTYYLITTIIKGKNNYIAGVFAAFFYMFNIFFAISLTSFTYFLLTYASLPLKLGLYIKGITERKNIKYILIFCLIWLISSASQYVNPKYLIIDLIPIIFFLIVFIFFIGDWLRIKEAIKFTIILFMVFILFNFYWLLPDIIYFKEMFFNTNSLYAVLATDRIKDFIRNSASLSSSYRLTGVWFFDPNNYFYWSKIYNNIFFILIGYFIAILVYLPIFFLHKLKKQDKSILIFFYLFLLTSLFFMTGSKDPLGFLKVILIKKIPLIAATFSIPYMLFGTFVALSYAVLIGYTVFFIYNNWFCFSFNKLLLIKKNLSLKYFILVIIFICIAIHSFPLFTGEVSNSNKFKGGNSYYRIPKYYYEAGDYIESQKEEFRILQLPYQLIYGSFIWNDHSYYGMDITDNILNKPIVKSISYNNIGADIASLMMDNSNLEKYDFSKIMALLNIKFILMNRDADFDFIKNVNFFISREATYFNKLFNSLKNFNLDKSFGKLDFYKISDDIFLPKIYSVDNINIINNNKISKEDTLRLMYKMVSLKNFDISNNIILFSSYLNAENKQVLNKIKNKINLVDDSNLNYYNFNNKDTINTSLSFYKINPLSYVIKAENVKNPFFVVFSENFNKDWKAYIKYNENDFDLKNYKFNLAYFSTLKNPIKECNHFFVNGYANAWYIEPAENSENFEIIIYFKNQNILYISLTISILIIIGSILFLFILGKFKKNLIKKSSFFKLKH